MSNPRLATVADAPLICDIRKNSILAQKPGIWTKEEIEVAANGFSLEFLTNELKSGQQFYLFGNNGFVSAKADYLAYLFVLPSSQNSGLGTKMLSFAEDMVKEFHNNIWLWSHPYTEAFYARNGYEKRPETYSPFGLPLHKFEKTFK